MKDGKHDKFFTRHDHGKGEKFVEACENSKENFKKLIQLSPFFKDKEVKIEKLIEFKKEQRLDKFLSLP